MPKTSRLCPQGHHGSVHQAAAEPEHDTRHAEQPHERRLPHGIGIVLCRLPKRVPPCECDDVQTDEDVCQIAPGVGRRAKDAGMQGFREGTCCFGNILKPDQPDIGVVVEVVENQQGKGNRGEGAPGEAMYPTRRVAKGVSVNRSLVYDVLLLSFSTQ